MKDALIVSILSLVPRNSSASLMGKIGRSRLSKLVTRAFVFVYGIDMTEASRELNDYASLEDLFTRELKPGLRPIDSNPNHLVSPVDGTIALLGSTTDQCLLLDGSQTLNTHELLGGGDDQEHDVAIIYLSPTNYHRVHVPHEGEAISWSYVPGTLWPVFPAAIRRVTGLFQKNERAIVRIKTNKGPLDVVLVGAFGVGRITLSVCDLLTNTGGSASEASISPPQKVSRGSELGIFHLGSTVILLSPKGTWSWLSKPGDAVLLGQAIAHHQNPL